MRHRGPRHFSALLTRRRSHPHRRFTGLAAGLPRLLTNRSAMRVVSALAATVMLLGGAVLAAGLVDDEGAEAASGAAQRPVTPDTSRSHTRAPMPSPGPVPDDGLGEQTATADDTATPEPEPAPARTPAQEQDDTTKPSLPVATPDVPSPDASLRVTASVPGVDTPSASEPGGQATSSGNAGNTDDTDGDRRTRADRRAPQTAIDSRPASHDDSRARFTFHASERASFMCSLDGAGFRPCDSGVTYEHLQPGWHDFAVRATDPAGNADGSPAGYRWHTTATGWTRDQVKDLLSNRRPRVEGPGSKAQRKGSGSNAQRRRLRPPG
jgi:hypothetical protein